jgi:hypothetical protein
LARATWQVVPRVLVLLVWLLALVVIFSNGFGDASEPLAPGAETRVGKIEGARLRNSTAAASIRAGDIRC